MVFGKHDELVYTSTVNDIGAMANKRFVHSGALNNAWAAMAVATTYHDKYIKGVQF